MFFDAPVAGSGRVYFNAFLIQTGGQWGGQGISPDVGTLGSRFSGVATMTYEAMLGVWSDCNQDGYIGLAEDAMTEYPTQLLSADQADTICPDGSAYNKGGWVTELLPIGPNWVNGAGDQAHRDPRMIADNASFVWADDGMPDESHVSGKCFLNAFPRGSLQSTGGIIAVVDCRLGFATGARVSTIVGTVPGGDAFLPSDPNNWNSPGPLNHKTFGSECASNGANPNAANCGSNDQSMAHLADCNAPTVNGATDDAILAALEANRPDAAKSPGTAQTEYNAVESQFAPATRGNVYQPAIGAPNPPQPNAGTPGEWGGGDVPATVNMTREEAPGAGLLLVSSDCNYNDDAGHDFYGTLQESDVTNTFGTPKTTTDWIFNYSAQMRTGTPTPIVTQSEPSAAVVSPDAPQCFGIWAYAGGAGCAKSMWSAITSFNSNVPPVVRADPNPIPAPKFATFYARASSSDGALPPGGGRYGAIQCPVIGTGAPVTGNWACDPAQWYHNPDGSAQTVLEGHASPGQPYDLRDVDCYDGQIVAGVPLYAGSGQLGSACGDPPA